MMKTKRGRGRPIDPDLAAAVTRGDKKFYRRKPCAKCKGHEFQVRNSWRGGYTTDCSDCRRAYRKQWRQDNPEKLARHRREHQARYRKTKHGKANIRRKSLARHALENLAPRWDDKAEAKGTHCHLSGVPISWAPKTEGRTPIDHDHIVPITWGGSHVASNLAPALSTLNSAKSNKLYVQELLIEDGRVIPNTPPRYYRFTRKAVRELQQLYGSTDKASRQATEVFLETMLDWKRRRDRLVSEMLEDRESARRFFEIKRKFHRQHPDTDAPIAIQEAWWAVSKTF